MPIFAAHGPNVPDELVQALEDDRVVLFCGAGVSMGAGLPGFQGLVEHVYREFGETPPPARSPQWLWPDRMLGALESRYTREEVRRVVVERLSRPPGDLALHQGLLRLARLQHSEGMRLVTTNFDRYFEDAQDGLTFGEHLHSGPILPIPRNDRIVSWRSIVYLHGRISDGGSNDQLVFTSADFGRAYLTDRWAARFVSKLFSEFTVLFVGYSLNDPVLRYMTDAFAAEDAQSRSLVARRRGYIFVPYNASSPPDADVWRLRRLEPIFYHDWRSHLRLKQTILAWAEAREDFFASASTMISTLAPRQPQSLTPGDVDNLLWAVLGRPDQGYGARLFADQPVPPPIEWLFEFQRREQLLTQRFEQAKAAAVQSREALPSEPVLYLDRLFPKVNAGSGLPVMETGWQLARWIARHLASFELADWVMGRLGEDRRPHLALRHAIRQALCVDATLQPGFRRFWQIVSSEGVPLGRESGPLLLDLFDRPGLHPADVTVHTDLVAALEPYLRLSANTWRNWWASQASDGADPSGARFRTVADAEVELTAGQPIQGFAERFRQTPGYETLLRDLTPDLTQLLRRALSLFALADMANEVHDPGFHDRPSIRPHRQNQTYHSWTYLIDLLWAAWRSIDASSSEESRDLVRHWTLIPFQTFRRLAVAAVTESPHFTSAEKLRILINGRF